MEQPKQNPVSICSRCQGTGIEERHPCTLCLGKGIGMNTPLGFLYWEKEIDSFAIVFRKWRKAFNNIVNMALLALGVLSAVGLVWNFYQLGWLPMAKLATWTQPNVYVFGFWIGLIFITFVIYRVILEGEYLKKIPRRKYDQEPID
ncbi:hypothetical protein GWN26_07275, partial [Candidatus Saccharibacteria bacterium]|nr:hypothetical protein [Candidatus Saccharibacteria bacterium]NIV03778.1 hypothetical protein [Calditrichia bacterium]NIS38298.1 hypothetical protein [Candidatus Saccharibacteria bacterium]NIV72073.1 hypothetical protein [Calditrichia bacterium]NIV98951.1 hypothetical protein [Candidatus Saccharibacteria bacterium]